MKTCDGHAYWAACKALFIRAASIAAFLCFKHRLYNTLLAGSLHFQPYTRAAP